MRERRDEELRNSGRRVTGSVSRSVSIGERLISSGRSAAVNIERMKRVATASRSPPSFRPKLDPVSVAMVHRRRPSDSEPVEERLLRLGRRIKAVKQAKIQQIMKNPQEPSTMETIERLMQYQQIYKDHKWMLAKGNSLDRPTFNPTIDRISEEIVAVKGKLDITRPKVKESNEQKATVFPFKPQLNPESLRLAAHKGDSASRLLSPRSHQSSANSYPFHPVINKTGGKESNAPRWESLYELNMKKMEKKAQARITAESEELEKWSFKPALNRPETGKNGKEVVSRLLEWGKDRISRLKQLQKDREGSQFEECTFAPMVISTQKLTPEEWGVYPPEQNSQFWPSEALSAAPSLKSFTPSHQSFKSTTPRQVSLDRIRLDSKETLPISSEEDSVDLEKLLKQLQAEK